MGVNPRTSIILGFYLVYIMIGLKLFFFQIWGIHFKVSLFFGGRNDEPRSLRNISLFTDIACTVSTNWRFVCFNLFPFLNVNTTRKHAFLINCTFVLFLTAET